MTKKGNNNNNVNAGVIELNKESTFIYFLNLYEL